MEHPYMSTTKMVTFRFIFYSLLTALLILLGAWLKPEEVQLFLTSWTLWREPLLAGILCGLLSAVLGVYILLNRIVFISLGIAQGASFGIFLAFFIAGFFGVTLGESVIPLSLGLIIALATTILFARLRRNRRLPDESMIGLIYVAASGLTILIGDRIAEGHHYIDNLLFGSAVAVSPSELKILLMVTLPLILIHYWFRREFLYVSADPEFMKIKGVKSGFWMTLLYFTLTLGITINLKTLGSLPIFALMVIPPLISLKRAQGIREAFWLSILLGIIIPPLGYFYSFLFSFPTGASLILVALLYTLASLLEALTLTASKGVSY